MKIMMTSSNGNIFRVTGPLCGEFTGPGEFPPQRQVTRSFDVFFDLRLNKRLSKQPWGWWFETTSWSLWRQCNVLQTCTNFIFERYHLNIYKYIWQGLTIAQKIYLPIRGPTIPSHKSHNAPASYPTMHQFVSVTKLCIVRYLPDAL